LDYFILLGMQRKYNTQVKLVCNSKTGKTQMSM